MENWKKEGAEIRERDWWGKQRLKIEKGNERKEKKDFTSECGTNETKEKKTDI